MSPDTLVAGGHARFSARGEPRAPALLIVALTASPRALSLSFLGSAHGCWLHVAGIVGTAATQFGPPAVPASPYHGGVAAVAVRVPADPRLFGAQLVTQWLSLGNQIEATNAVQCTLASGVPTAGMATVTHRDGQTAGIGTVSVVSAPVLRLEGR